MEALIQPTETTPGSILVVADAARIPALNAALEGPGRVVSASDEMGEAMVRVAEGGRDMVLVDLGVLAGPIALSVLDASKMDSPDTAVVVLADPDEPEHVDTALERGATYAMVRPSDMRVLSQVAELVLRASGAVSASRFRLALEAIGGASSARHCVAHLLDWSTSLTGAAGAAFVRRGADGRVWAATHKREHPEQVKAAVELALEREALMQLRGTPGERRGMKLGDEVKLGPALVWPLETSVHPPCALVVLRPEGAAPFNDHEVDRLAALRQVATLALDHLALDSAVRVQLPAASVAPAAPAAVPTGEVVVPSTRDAAIMDYALQLEPPLKELSGAFLEAVDAVRGLQGSAMAVIALQSAREGLDRIEDVMKELLVLGRAADAAGTPADAVVNIAMRLTEVPEEIEFVTELDAFMIAGDPVQLALALRQLVDNAARAASEIVVIRMFRHDDFCHIVIKDDGRGMSRDVLARAFAHGFTTRADAAGVGLTEARKVIEQADGSIALTSHEGAGARVEVALPLVL